MRKIFDQPTSKIEDVKTEVLFIGCLYKNPDLLLDYGDLINSKYDFNQPTSKFLYDSIYEMFNYHTKGDITESKINVFMSQDPERKKKYDEIKGYSTIKRYMDVADLEEISIYYDKLKKFSLLREFERKQFPVQKIMKNKNFSKLTAEQIVQAMEYQISTISTQIGGIKDSVILGKNMTNRVQEWKRKPDVGLPLPFEIINMLIRGLRNKKLTLTGMHSGCGKSRMTSKVASYIGILLGIPVFVAVNEQDEDEWDAMVLSCVINNPEFHYDKDGELNEVGRAIREYNMFDGIDETKIVTGAYDDNEEAVIMTAASFIEKNSKIHFLELERYDEKYLRREFKRHKIKGCKLMIYDTLKSLDYDWQSFVRMGNMLKNIAKELAVSVWATFQLTDDSLFQEILTSQAIANGKHIKHIADGLFMARPLAKDEYDKYIIYNPNGFAGTERRRLNYNETYYVVFVDKNRGGRDKDRICLRVDKGKNLWIEEGYLVLSDDEKEFNAYKKEYARLKKEKQVRKLREELGKTG